MTDLPTSPLPPRGRRAAASRWLRRGLAVVVLGLVTVALVAEVRHQIANDEWQRVELRPAWLVACALAMFGAYACLLTSQRMILHAFTGRRIAWRVMVPVAWVPLAGKYLPGKVAAVGAAVVIMRKIGIAGGAALSSFLLLDALPVISGTMLGSFLLWDPAVREAVPWAPAAGVAVIVGGLICLSPPVFARLTGLGLRVLRRAPLTHVPTLRDYLGPSLVFLVQWVFHTLSVWFACLAVLPSGEGPSLADFPRLVGITSLALVLSYFAAVLSPAGLGLREGVFVVLLGTVVAPAAAVAAAVSLRLVNVLLEGLLFAVGVASMRVLRLETQADRPPDHAEGRA